MHLSTIALHSSVILTAVAIIAGRRRRCVTAALVDLCMVYAAAAFTVPSKWAKNVVRSETPRAYAMLDCTVMLETLEEKGPTNTHLGSVEGYQQ